MFDTTQHAPSGMVGPLADADGPAQPDLPSGQGGPERDSVFLALEESERRFRASMEHSPIGMALTRMDGTWIDVNPALCRFLGYSKPELMAAGFKAVTYPEDREATVQMARRMVATHQKSVTLEKRYIHASGAILIGQLSLTVVRDAEDRPIMYISQIVDVTAARQLDHLKSEFITTVNHELRTPLTGVMGALALLEKLSSAGATDRDRSLLAVALKNANRLKSLLDDILEMDVMNAQGDQVLMQDVDVGAVLRKTMATVQEKADASSVTMCATLPDHALICETDADRLGRVLRILLANAVKYSDSGGEVAVKTDASADAVRVTVTNGGQPIPEKMRPFLFQPFVQGEDTGVRRKQGSGLGLSIAKHLADSLGAGIGFTSTEGATSFWVDLPRINRKE